jgi:putative acyl-CoA dehydrogenase
VAELTDAEVQARRLVEQMATCWDASLLVRHGDGDVADGYIRSRLDGDWGPLPGTLPADAALESIARRAVPAI